MSDRVQYALVAISNTNRAATFRQALVDTTHLETIVVRDGDAALDEMTARGAPALLIVDLSLPKVDGFAVIRKMRRQNGDATTRVIAVAAHAALLAAARELAVPLAISSILPLDVDRTELATVLITEMRAVTRPVEGSSEDTGSQRGAPAANGVDDVIDHAAGEARRRSRLPMCIGYLKTGGQEHFTFRMAAGDGGPSGTIGDLADFGFLRQVAESVDPLVIPNVESHPVFAQLLLKGARPIRGFVAVPVTMQTQRVRAAICILDTKPITLSAADIDALSAYGREVGVEIERVLAAPAGSRGERPLRSRSIPEAQSEDLKALQQLAATDPLTSLSNRRGGEKHIATEISRAKREKRPLSCVLLDLDRFKQVNDTFGHQAGDQLLRDVSHLLRRTVRAYDILIRWGGEEFLMVLPGVDLDMARMLAERVRAAVESLETHGIGPVTISAGVATFENDYDFAATLKAADRRLYQAKASGRNAVV